ncbi:neprilysin-1-like [Musca vetustissima]|uniref:neprilysin-1-like n=1 Tax=Musca vetustissima TaxID=27455 RepID=UPI002AB7C94D|nr:neprilysin-1-like [Musca vetustissima]
MKTRFKYVEILLVLFLLEVTRAAELPTISKARNILKFMNPAADPCSNFYEFTCGNFPRIYPAILSQQAETSVLGIMQSDLEHIMFSVLNSPNMTMDTISHGKVKDFYNSCLNLRHSGWLYMAKLKEIIAEFGQMPALSENWSDEDFNWLQVVAEISKKYDLQIIIGKYVRRDLYDKRRNTVYFDLPSFGLPKPEMFLNPAYKLLLEEYRLAIGQHLRNYLGVNEIMAQKFSQEILGFEVALAMGTVNETGIFTQPYEYVDYLKREYPEDLDLFKYLEIALDGPLPKGKIIDNCPVYHKNLLKIIRRTPKRIMANYIFYSLLRNFLLSPFPNTLEDLQKGCVSLTRKYFENILDNMVYRRTNVKDAEQAVINMAYDFKTVMELSLRQNTWLSSKIQRRIKDKLKSLKVIIKSYADQDFSADFEQFLIDENDFCGNLKSIFILRAMETKSNLNSPPKANYNSLSTSLLPKYLKEENALVVPVGFLQPLFFWHSSYPASIKLSQLGFFIAHEMMHAIDAEGIFYDPDGQYSYWNNGKLPEAFTMRKYCYSKQHSGGNYIFGGIKIPELQSDLENMADADGLRWAFKTFTMWYNSPLLANLNISSEVLPNLDYQDHQLFFINFAQLWCNDVNPLMTGLPFVPNGDYISGNLKVMSVLTNVKEFFETFHCEKPKKPFVCEVY